MARHLQIQTRITKHKNGARPKFRNSYQVFGTQRTSGRGMNIKRRSNFDFLVPPKAANIPKLGLAHFPEELEKKRKREKEKKLFPFFSGKWTLTTTPTFICKWCSRRTLECGSLFACSYFWLVPNCDYIGSKKPNIPSYLSGLFEQATGLLQLRWILWVCDYVHCMKANIHHRSSLGVKRESEMTNTSVHFSHSLLERKRK